MDENKIELNDEQLDDVSGGKRVAAGGSPTRLPDKQGYVVYKIGAKDTLIRIANRYNTTAAKIQACNPSIKDKNLIRTGYYIYVPVDNG